MMRRSRISVRPFVRPGGRGPPAPSQDQKLSEDAGASWKAGEDNQAAEQEVAGEGAAVTQPIVPAGSSDEAALDAAQQNVPVNPAEKSQDAGGAGSSNPSAPALQRRKRFSAMPNLAKPRPTPAPARPPARATPRSPPAKQVASPVIENNVTTPEDGTQTDDAPHAVLRSPSRRRPSGGRQAKVAEKSGHLKDDTAVTSNQHPPAGQVKKAAVENAQKPSPSPVKMKDSQASTSQGRARLVSGSSATNGKDTKGSTVSSKQLPSQPSLPLNKLSISEDRERILKARKLRELLKQEIRNEKRLKKGKTSMLEYTVPQDRSKMVMRDFIYYLPESNPMKSALEPEHKQTERVMPPPTPVRPPVNEEMDDDDDDNNDEPVQDDQLVVPRVKVAEDGTLIIDEESLTVEVLRVKGPNVVEENDPIFERGSTTTYSSFRKANYTKPWSNKETDMFFLAISMVGTDFSMIGQLFPHRARIEIKNKFKKEEKTNSWRIDKAFKEKKPIDIEFFSELLERIRADDERKKNKSKTKSARQRKPAKPRTKRKENKGDPEEAPEGSVALVGADSDGGEGDSETAEKENEETFNVNDCQEAEASPDAPPAKKKRKRKKEAEGAEEACLEKPGDDKKRQKKRMKKTLEEGPADDAIVGEKSDDAQSNAQPSAEDADGSQETEMPGKERKGPGGKPAGLGRGRLQKPQPNLGKRRGKKAQEAAEKPGAEVETEGEPAKAKRTAVSQASKETEDQTTDCVAPSFVERKRSSKRDKRRARVLSSDCESQGEEEEEEEADLTAVQEHMLSKPTRSGRIPKFSKHLQQPEDDDDGGDDSIEASPFASLPQPQEDAPSIRRGAKKPKPNTSCNQKERRAGKAKLVMLRASVENEDDNEEEADEGRTEEDYCYPTNPEELNQAPAFVPVSLRSPVAIPVEVEETMEELEISHIDTHCTSESEHTIYSQSVCALGPGSQEEGVVATENQLDLLVDVIHFISQECMTAEISESDTEINTEAAQTLLTIRHPEFLSPVTGGPSSEQVISEEPSSQQQVVIEELDSEPADQSQCLSEAPQAMTCDSPVAVTCTDITEEPEMASQAASCETLSPAEEPQTPKRESTNDVCVSDAKEGLSSPDSSALSGSRCRRSRFSKPVPNLGRTARGPQPRPAPSEAPHDSSAVPVTVESVVHKSSEGETRDSDSLKEKDLSEGRSDKEEIPEGTQKQAETPSVSEDPEISVESSAAVPDSPSLAESRGRRSRFSKPIPNLGRTARGPQPRPAPSEAPPPSSVENESLAALPSDRSAVPLTAESSQKSSVEESSDSDGMKEKDIPDIPGEETHKSDNTPSVSESPEVSVESSAAFPDSPSLAESRGRRSRFSKPIPNLGRTARGPQPRPAPSEAPPPSSVENESLAALPSDRSAVPLTAESSQKSSVEESSDSDGMKEKDIPDIPGEETHKSDNTPSVSESPEVSVESSAAFPDSPSLAESRGRRSRFSKPIPNLGRTARGPQPRPAPSEAPPPSSVENESLAALPSDRSAVPLTAESSQKSSVEESSDSDGMKEKDIPDIPGEETHKSDNTPSVSESPEVSVESSAAFPDSPSLAESRGRRSRFSKPIPNLGRTARGPQPRPAPSEAPPPSSGERPGNREIVLPSDSPDVPVTEQKSSEEEKPVLDSGKEKDVPGKPRDKPELCEDVQKLDDTPSVSEAPEVSVDVSAAVPDSPALPGSCCRRSRFSKAIPNLGRTARDPLPRPAPIGATPPSSVDQTGTSSDQVSSREKRTANSNDLVAQEGIVHKTVCSTVQKEEANISVEQNQSTAATDTESSDSGACSAVRESGLAKGSADTDSEHTGHSVIGTDDAQVEVTCIQTDESLNVPITTEVTQGALETDESAQQEPTFILTLFEIPPCDLNTYQDVSGAMTPASTDFPPPVLVESPPAVLLGASQRSSCAPVSVETELGAQTVGGESGGRSVHVDDWTASKKLNLLTSSPGQEATASYCAGPEATGQPPLTAPTSSVTHGLECPADSCDEDPVSLILEPVVESDAAAYAETEGTSEDDARSRGKRKLPMGTRRGKLKVKPNTSNRKAAVSSKGVLGISKPLPTQDETPGLSRVVRGGPVPAPSVSPESSGESEVPHAEGLSPCTMNNEELSQQVSTPAGEGIDSESTGSDLSASPRVAPPASTTSLVRPGRKPRGFLSLFAKKNTPASPAPSKTTRAAPQRPQFNASRLERKRTTATAAIDASSDSSIVNSPPAKHRPSTSQSGATSQTISISATESKTSETPKQEVLCATNSENDEGPTKVSEYFFSDIFTEVDEPD
ncbi:transcription factor TFIIIB component B'' homolog isoform X2 [Amia ocellicauda]|uniref:transcription factor TFIIIB component B'' homolog isoform X2 n=1 Tax=Amia ocellicauda TaxID=2972642 RepID=UPI003463A890